MANYEVDLRKGISPGFSLLKLMGHWKPQSTNPSTINWYKIYSVPVVSTFLITFLITEFISIITCRGNLEKITEVSFLFVTHVSQTIKFSQFVVNMDRIQNMIDSLNQPRFQPRSKWQALRLQGYISLARFAFYGFFAMSIGTVAFWAAAPLLQMTNDEWQLPLSSWFPFSTNRSGTYEVAYIYQVLSTGVNTSTNVSMDICVTVFMILLGGELDLLNDTLANLKQFALERVRLRREDITHIQDDSSFEDLPQVLENEMDLIFVECVYHHRSILGFAKEIESVFNYGVLSLFTVGVLVICFTMFELSLAEQFSLRFFALMMYQSFMLVEILLYCWFGNEIILKSSDIATSIYSSDWLRSSVSYRRKLLIMMTRTQVPIQMQAANLFMMSLSTFAAILKTSWSYFAVLRNVHSDNE